MKLHYHLQTIKSEFKWAWQRVFRGWDDRAIWSLDLFLIEYMPIWLEEIKEQGDIPGSFFTEDNTIGVAEAQERWHNVINEMITGFIAAGRYAESTYDFGRNSAQEVKKLMARDKALVDRAFDLFKEYFFELWI